jgi:sugar phosphate permease
VRDAVPDRVSGAAIGLVNAFGGLGAFAGSYIVGWLTGGGATGVAFLLMAISQLIAALLVLAVRERDRRRPTRFVRESVSGLTEARESAPSRG